MFYETAQTIGPTWHGKSFKPSHYDDVSWKHPSSGSGHFRSPGSSPTIRRRIINYDDDDDDDTEHAHMFPRRSPSFDRKFFKDVWDDYSRREDPFEDRTRMFRRNVKHDWDKDIDDFEDAMRRDKEFRSEFQEPQNDGYESRHEPGSGRVHHIPIMVETRRNKASNEGTYRSGCSPPPPSPSREQQDFVDESDEWLRHHMNRLRQNFDSRFSTLQNRHRLPRVDLSSRPRAFTSPIVDWDPESVHTLPTRKHHSRVVMDEKKNPKSVFRSYSETHEDIPREHPTASRSHSDSHCPKTAYVTKVSVNVPSAKPEESGTAKCDEVPTNEPQPPPRRTRCRPRKEDDNLESKQDGDPPQTSISGEQTDEPRRRNRCRPRKEDENLESKQEDEQQQDKILHTNQSSSSDEKTERKAKSDENSEVDSSKTSEDSGAPKTRKNSCKDSRGANALLQISAVLQNVEDLLCHVEAYSGNGRDKQFRFLDEMLTRCMLRLDDVDTDGLDDVRTARKAAVRQVQACIEKLESRAMEGQEKGDKKDEIDEDGTKTEESSPPEGPKQCCNEEKTDVSNNDNEEAEQTRL